MKTVPAAARANLERFLEVLAEYVVLRNHAIWLNLARGGDVDLLVADADEAEETLLFHLGIPLWTARRSYVRGYFYPWGHIDLLPSLEWRGAGYLPNRIVFEMVQQSHSGFPRPRLSHEALVSWFSSLLWGGFFKERYRAVILKAMREDGAALRQVLIRAAGRIWGERLWQAAAAGRPEASVKWVGSVRRAVWWQAFRRGPWDTLRGWFAFYRAEIGLRLRPPVPWVAVLGPDGSGKSSVLNALETRLAPIFTGTKIYHWRPGFLRSSKGVSGPVTDPHGKPPRGVLTSLLKLGFLSLDWTLGYWARLVHLRAKGRLVLFDRNYYDLLVDPKRYRYAGPLWLARFVGWFIPRPDLVILLDAPPEVIQTRKQEVPLEEATRQRQAYLKLVGSLPQGNVVDALRSLNDVVPEVEKVILDYTAKRTAHRLRLREGK